MSEISKLQPTRKSKINCCIMFLMLSVIYIFENSSIKDLMDDFTSNYLIKPALWIAAAVIVWSLPHIRARGKLKLKGLINFWALNFATLYIIISVLSGVVDALGKSPYNHSPTGILTNILFVGSSLVGREFIRSYLVNSLTDEDNYLVFIIVAVIMTFSSTSFSSYLEVVKYEDLVKLIAEQIAPEFAQNLFAAYLVHLGGPLTSIIYLGIIQGFNWLSPVLPDLKWITKALIGILCPIFFMMSMQGIYMDASKQCKTREKDKEGTVGWILTSLVSIGVIWFSVGVFPIYPSVIATGSMEPGIKPGDVILVEKIIGMEEVNKLKVEDVIQFRRDSILISHRIIDIRMDEKEGIGFVTKGDNNNSPDAEIVRPEHIKGKVIHTVPKVGWPTLLIKSDKNIPMDDIVN